MAALKNLGKPPRFLRNLHEPMVFEKVSEAIKVQVTPIFIDDESEPEENHFVWAYQVRIENHGADSVQITDRHWEITDSDGFVQEVDGEGVVGERPILKADAGFEYTSSVALCTPSGFMEGYYIMKRLRDQESFYVSIPAFSLDSPHASTVIN